MSMLDPCTIHLFLGRKELKDIVHHNDISRAQVFFPRITKCVCFDHLYSRRQAKFRHLHD